MSDEKYSVQRNFDPVKDYSLLLNEIGELFESAVSQNWEEADDKWESFYTHFGIVQNKYSKVNWEDYPRSERDSCAQAIAEIIDFHDRLIDLIKLKQSQVQSELGSLTTTSRLNKVYK